MHLSLAQGYGTSGAQCLLPHAPRIPVNSFPDSPELFDHIPVTYEETGNEVTAMVDSK